MQHEIFPSDVELEKAEEILESKVAPEGYDRNKFGVFYVGVTGKHQVFYTLYRFRPSNSPYVEPLTYVCNLSTDLIDACIKARRIAGKIPVELDTYGTCKRLVGAAKALIIKFGKYRGVNIEEVFGNDPQYIVWMKKAADKGELKIDGNMHKEVERLSGIFWEGVTKKNEENSTSGFIGNLGERLTMKVKILGIVEGKVKLVDENGNRLYTYTGSFDVKKDDEVTIKGTVTSHKLIVGIKQTYINRVRLM